MTKLINSEEVVINEVKRIIEESKKKEQSMVIDLLKDYQQNLLRSMEAGLIKVIYG